MENKLITAFVTRQTSTKLYCKLVCGKERGSNLVIDIIEIYHCAELFGAPILQEMLSSVKNLTWKATNRSKSKETASYRPKLKEDFYVPSDEPHKRK